MATGARVTVNTQRLKPLLLVIFAALVLIGGQFFFALPSCNYRAYCFDFWIYAYSPYHYRVLPYFLEGMPQAYSSALIMADVVIHSACVLLICTGLFIWLKRWVTPAGAIVGVLLLAVQWMFAYNYYQRDIATALELLFAVWFLVLINGRLLSLAAIVALASLNRETGFLLIVLWALYHLPERRTRRYWVNIGVLLLTYAAVYIGLRLALGNVDHILGLGGTLAYNLDTIPGAALVNVIIAPLWIVALLSIRSAPPPLRRMFAVLLLYVPMMLIGGGWFEIPRLLLPMFPVILPVAILGLLPTE